MCGILGSINKPFIEDTLDLIKHRGPDRQAVVSDTCCGKHVLLGHTRLSIVDLTDAGNQPMISEDGMYILIFNGEIYNHEDLRKEIKFRRFRGHSDSETLLYYLIEKGTEGIKDLNGIFAFALLDKVKNRVVMARDPFGVKPLYYSQKGNECV